MTQMVVETIPLIRSLLGDPAHLGIADVDSWVARADDQRATATERTEPQLPLLFEFACALLYDARLFQARQHFMTLVAARRAESVPSPLQVLARIGVGRSLSLLRRHQRAEETLERAVVTAQQSRVPLLLELAGLFRDLNRSDWGRPGTDLDESQKPEKERCSDDPVLDALLDAYRVLARSRVLLRACKRSEGLALLDRFVEHPFFVNLAYIPMGSITRMRGIFNAILSRGGAARSDLEDAIAIFESGQYRMGQVQAALSLAEISGPIDHDLTRNYLSKAVRILDEEVDHGEDDTSTGRQMPGERAKLYSRLARLELLRGKLDDAVHYARKDIDAVARLGGDGANLPRMSAHAHRNLAKILHAQRHFRDAADILLKASSMFEQVDDFAHMFFCHAERVDAFLEDSKFDLASTELIALEQCLQRLPDERAKEQAIIKMLRAICAWKVDHDTDIAQLMLSEVQSTLRDIGYDYYYLRALVAEAEILHDSGDDASASVKLQEARKWAGSLEIEEMRRTIDGLSHKIAMQPGDETLRGRFNLTILYADIRGFTSVCSDVDAEVMGEFIGQFASLVSRCGTRHGGRPVRFLGDCVMTLFADGVAAKEFLALECACEMQRLFRAMCRHWGSRDKGVAQLAKLTLGFGIASGDVIAGTFGYGQLQEYSVVGRAANLAARLQGHADGGEAVLCAATVQVVGWAFSADNLRPANLPVKGLPDVNAARIWTRTAEASLTKANRALMRPRARDTFAREANLSLPG